MDIQKLKVTIELWQKEKWIVARIPELDIVARGETIEKAKENLMEVVPYVLAEFNTPEVILALTESKDNGNMYSAFSLLWLKGLQYNNLCKEFINISKLGLPQDGNIPEFYLKALCKWGKYYGALSCYYESDIFSNCLVDVPSISVLDRVILSLFPEETPVVNTNEKDSILLRQFEHLDNWLGKNKSNIIWDDIKNKYYIKK